MKVASLIGDWLLSNGGIVMGAIAGVFSWFAHQHASAFWRRLPLAGVVLGTVWALLSAQYADRAHDEQVAQQIGTIESYVHSQTAEIERVLELGLGMTVSVANGLNVE